MLAGLFDPGFLMMAAPRLLAWWMVCLLATAAVLPLCLRVFRALPDRGVGLAPAVGIALTTLGAWWLGFAWFGQLPAAVPVRGLMLALGAALAGGAWAMGARQWRAYVPAGSAAALGLLHLPHIGITVWLVMAGLGGLSAVVWWGQRTALRRAVMMSLRPLIFSQVLFLAGLLLFASFRSYLPAAYYSPSGWGAEKFGNLMNLNTALRATTLPPADAWFAGHPTNYYYGGHLATATIAKASATPPGVAFTLGLATTVGLTMSVGFSLTLALLGLFRRTARGASPVAMGWGVLGGVGTAMFGNVDAWHQWGQRGIAAFDFWRSSRAFHGASPYEPAAGTITEFPAFSAILGDLHPHHMALPYSMVVMAALVALDRGAVRLAVGDGRWWARAWAPLVAAGAMMGFVYTVNVWDAVVLAPMVAAGIAIARRGVGEIAMEWRWLAFFCMAALLGMTASFAWNMQFGAVPLPGRGVGLIAMPLLATAMALGVVYRSELKFGYGMAAASLVGLFVVCWAGAHAGLRDWDGDRESAPGALSLAVRDFAVMAAMAGLAAWITLRRDATGWRGFTSGGFAYLLSGLAALVVAAPFLLTTYTPLSPPPAPILRNMMPPLIDRELLVYPDGTWDELWRRTTIKMFSGELRTTLGDYLTHWGVLLAPLLALLAMRVAMAARTWGEGRGFALSMVLVAVFCGVYNALGYVVGPLALVLGGLSLVLALSEGRRRALWALLAVGFGWHWFVEVFHIDDEMTGIFERYNTPFKILFPLWPIFVAGAVVAVREAAVALAPAPRPMESTDVVSTLRAIIVAAVLALLVAPWLMRMGGVPELQKPWLVLISVAGVGFVVAAIVTSRRHDSWAATFPIMASWLRSLPALAPAALLLVVGLLYPYAAATARTGKWGAEPILGFQKVHERTLDALAYFDLDDHVGGPRPGERDAIEWLRVNVERGALVLEAPPTHDAGAYGPVGRFAAGSGVPTLVGWSHHMRMWRGWQRPVPSRLAGKYAEFFGATELQLGSMIGIFFPERATDPALVGDLRAIAFAAPAERPSIIARTFPDMDAQKRRELLAEFSLPGVGQVTSNQLIDLLASHAQQLFEAREFTPEFEHLLRFHNIRYVVIGSLEKERYDKDQLGKFDSWDVVHENADVTIRRVPDALFVASKEATR